MTHSFYAIMGGFVIDTNDKENADFIENSPQLTLTARGLMLLVKEGHSVPEVSEKSIQDRSKADGLAKILVCLQAGYMIVQCAGRAAAHLPLTLLEINTLGHVFCALIMYLFWMQKPQDLRETTTIPVKGIREITAFMFMQSTVSFRGRASETEFVTYYQQGGA